MRNKNSYILEFNLIRVNLITYFWLMRVFYVLAFLFFFNSVNAQDYVIDRVVPEPQISSKLSFGFSPLIFIAANRYKPGVGVGLEANINYEFIKHLSLGGFVRTKGLITGVPPIPGTGKSNSSLLGFGAIAFGGFLEGKLGERIGLNVKLGYEEFFSYDRISPGFIYGGGMNLYFNRSKSLKSQSSLSFSVVFEGNNYIDFPVLDFGANRFKLVEINAFTFQIGWRIQFYSVN